MLIKITYFNEILMITMKDRKQLSALGNILSSRKMKVLLVCFTLMCGLLFIVTSIPAKATNGNLVLYAPQTSTPPHIDGVLSPGEWDNGTHYKTYFVPTTAHPSDYIDVFLLSQPDALYIAYDVQPDNTTETDDMAYLAFDLDNDDTQDFLLYVSRDRSANVVSLGGNCTSLIWEIAFGFNTTPQEPGRNHTIIEIKISLNQTPYTTQTPTGLTHLPFGISPVGVCFGGYGTLSPGWFYGNSSNYNNMASPNATTYADLYLGDPPLPPTTFTAPYTSSPPTIDGILSPGEWSGATQLQIYFEPTSYHPPDYINVFLLCQNDALYIAYDVLPDDTTEPGDQAFIFLDLNNNGTEDVWLTFGRSGGFSKQLIDGTNLINLVWDFDFGFTTTDLEPDRIHTTFELMVKINRADTFTGDATFTALPFANSPVGILFSGYGTLSPTWYLGNSSAAPDNPQTNYDATMYGDLTLGSPSDDFPWWIFIPAIGLPALAIVLLIRRKRKSA